MLDMVGSIAQHNPHLNTGVPWDPRIVVGLLEQSQMEVPELRFVWDDVGKEQVYNSGIATITVNKKATWFAEDPWTTYALEHCFVL